MDKRKFRVALAQKGIPQIRVATDLKIDPGTISRWVNGYHVPRGRDQERISNYLGVPRNELFPNLNHQGEINP